MANVIITSDTNHIKVDFGDYYPVDVKFIKASYNPSHIVKTWEYSDYIKVFLSDGTMWKVQPPSGTNQKALIVDEIDGNIPSDIDDLNNKIMALIRA